jgi:hypothetical protein
VSKVTLLHAALVGLAMLGAPAAAVLAADPAPTTAPNSKAVDRLNLDATAITGNRELPR